MSVTGVPSLLITFKTKIEEGVSLVPAMGAEDKLKAVQFWNEISERLQEIVNSSAADLNALALKMEKETADKLSQSQRTDQQSSHFINGNEFSATESFTDAVNSFVPSDGLPSARSQLSYLPQHSLSNSTMQRVHMQPATLNRSDAPLDDPGHNRVVPCTNSMVVEERFEVQRDRDDEQKEKAKRKQRFARKSLPKCKTKEVLRESNNDLKEDEETPDDDSAGGRLKTILVVENDGQEALEDTENEGSDVQDEDAACSEDIDELDSEEEEKEVKRLPPPKRGPNGTYVCLYCNKEWASSSAFTSHRWVHTKPYSCAECSARFSTRGNLTVHQRRHTGEKPFLCDQCDARFSTNGNLKRHAKTHTGEKPWECPQCNHRFTEKKSLKVHMRRHTGEKPYQCRVCGKKFAQTGILQTHMALHLDQKTHLCDNCGKSFRQRSQLRLHMLRHEGVKKYPCSSCPAKFLTKGDLERHHRVHTGERPFVCELCGKTFTRQQSLNEHMNRHYGLKPYQCKYCLKQFAEMSACYKHIKQHERAKNGQNPLENSPECTSMNQTDLMNLQLPSDSNGDIIEVSEAYENDLEDHKYTVLVHAGEQPIEVTSEMIVAHQDTTSGGSTILPTTDDRQITVTVAEHMVANFASINLLASTSSFQ